MRKISLLLLAILSTVGVLADGWDTNLYKQIEQSIQAPVARVLHIPVFTDAARYLLRPQRQAAYKIPAGRRRFSGSEPRRYGVCSPNDSRVTS